MLIRIKTIYWGFLLLSLLACQGQQEVESEVTQPETGKNYERIVSLSGAITELLFAMGQGDNIVGIDVTSTYPADHLHAIPRLGHVRLLNTEAVLGLQPDLIIAEKGTEESDQLAVLSGSGIEIFFLEQENSLDNPINMAQQLADQLDAQAYLAKLKSAMAEDKKALRTQLEKFSTKPRVLFIYARWTGSMMVAGTATPAAAMIELAGGENAMAGFEGFKALSTEGLLQANPDVLLLFESGLQSIGGPTGLQKIPGVSEVTAGKKEQFIAMDGLYLLGFTPRVGQAALELSQQLLQFQQVSAQ